MVGDLTSMTCIHITFFFPLPFLFWHRERRFQRHLLADKQGDPEVMKHDGGGGNNLVKYTVLWSISTQSYSCQYTLGDEFDSG